MSEDKREALSAFMDGELEGDASAIIDDLLRDDRVRRKWHHYHLIGDTLRHSLPEHLDEQLATGISARLRSEPTILNPGRRPLPPYLKPVAGLAVAASVAAMAIIGIQHQGSSDQATPAVAQPALATAASAPIQQASTPVRQGGATVEEASDQLPALQPVQPNIPAMRSYTFPVRKVSAGGATAAPATAVPQDGPNSRLRNYLINYNEYHATAGMQGMPPYVRIVAHDNQ